MACCFPLFSHLIKGAEQKDRVSQSIQPSSTIYLVRHGQAGNNLVDHDGDAFALRRDEKYADPALTDKGVKQASEAKANLADILKQNGHGTVDIVVSSTLRRALQTAELAACPLVATSTPRLACELATEIQCDDVWNEPRSTDDVASDWPAWAIEGGVLSEHCFRAIEGHDNMVARCEGLWKRLTELGAPVIVFVGHNGFLTTFQRRLALASGEAVPEAMMANAEVRKCTLPPYDGKKLGCKEAFEAYPNTGISVDYLLRRQRSVDVVNKARRTGMAEPLWAATEWRKPPQVMARTEEELTL